MFMITTEHHCYTVMFRLSFCEEQWPYLISAKDAGDILVLCPPEGSVTSSSTAMLLRAEAGGSTTTAHQSEPSYTEHTNAYLDQITSTTGYTGSSYFYRQAVTTP